MADGPESDADAIRRLEQRLDRAAQTAERLLSDAVAAGAAGAAGAARAASSPPPGGWQRPASETGDTQRGGDELEVLLSVLGAMRDWIPAELQQRLTEAIREVLLALRALIDWYLERTQRPAAGDGERVQDIPIL